MTTHVAALAASYDPSLPLAAAGVRIPLWGLPILLVVAGGIALYQKSRDGGR